MSEPRKHHFLPVCYLKGFTLDNSPEGRLHCFDLQSGKRFAATPRTTAYERDLYKADVPDGDDAFFIERIFARSIEDRFGEVLDRIVRHKRLPRNVPDQRLLLNFIALQGARVPANLERVEQVATMSAIEPMRKLANNPDELRSLKRKAAKEGEQLELSPQDVDEIIQRYDEGHMEIALTPNQRHYAMLQVMTVLLKWIATRRCRLLISEDTAPDLLCSDRPFFMTFPQLHPPGVVDPEAHRDGRMTFPLTRRMHLSASLKLETGGVRTCPSSTIAAVNHRIALHASRFVYSPNPVFAYRAKDKKLYDSGDLAPLLDHRRQRGAD